MREINFPMYRICLCLLVFTHLLSGAVFAQGGPDIPLTPEAWTSQGAAPTFVTHRGRQALRPPADGGVALTRTLTDFRDGTVDFDIAFTDSTRFTGFYFRVDSTTYEHVYLRVQRRDPMASDHIQYAAVLAGANLWDLRPAYQSNADLNYDDWNHVRIVMRDRRLVAYVNDMETPALVVPRTDGPLVASAIAFDGAVFVSGVTVRPGEYGDLPAGKGFDVTDNDPRYLRKWEVTQPRPLAPDATPIRLPVGNEESDLPGDDAGWTPIATETFGLVNLSRPFGATPGGEQRVVWLRTTITAEEAQTRRLDLGFSDAVVLFLNGGLLGIDRTVYLAPGMAQPEGRLALENSTWELPLRAGENELLIAVTNFFYGWGIVARLDNGRGLRY